MQEEIPKIDFNESQSLGIEVMNFTELRDKLLIQSKDHDPFSAHRLKFFMVLILTKNTYSHFVDFKSYQLLEGSALFVAKNQVHHFTKELLNAEGICIIFNSAFFDKGYSLSENFQFNRLYNYHIETPVIHQYQMGQDNLKGVSYRLYVEYGFPDSFAKTQILRALLHVLLLKAERTKDHQTVSGIKTQWLEIFNRFKNLLESNYTTTRSSKFYAQQLFISYKFLNEVVKKLAGKTVKAFIDDFVTMEIKRYLVATSLSVKEISYETGFEDPPNMVKFFKKNTDMTPFRFRQQF